MTFWSEKVIHSATNTRPHCQRNTGEHGRTRQETRSHCTRVFPDKRCHPVIGAPVVMARIPPVPPAENSAQTRRGRGRSAPPKWCVLPGTLRALPSLRSSPPLRPRTPPSPASPHPCVPDRYRRQRGDGRPFPPGTRGRRKQGPSLALTGAVGERWVLGCLSGPGPARTLTSQQRPVVADRPGRRPGQVRTG